NLRLIRGDTSGTEIVTVRFDLENVGSRDGAEVPQLYVQDIESSLPRPIKELKGFQRVFLKAGAKQTVSIPLDTKAFAFYDPAKHAWIAETGDFKILVGSSSRDLRLAGTFRLAETKELSDSQGSLQD